MASYLCVILSVEKKLLSYKKSYIKKFLTIIFKKMSDKKPKRREFLFTASYAVGAVGVGAVVWPLVDQMNPDASVKALASTEVDVSSVKPGNTITVLWRGKPVFIRRRTPEEISEAKSVKNGRFKTS